MKYTICNNLECGCPLSDDQDFCDNCNTPSHAFLKSTSHQSDTGAQLGFTPDGNRFSLSLDHVHYAFYGMTKTGKTRAAIKLAIEASRNNIKLLVIDPEGEWKNIIPYLTGNTEYFLSLKNLKINPFQLSGGDKGLIAILLKETIFQHGKQDFFQFTASMEALLDEGIAMSSSIPELIENIKYITKEELKTKLVNLEATRAAVLVRLRPLEENESLRQIFYCDKSSLDLNKMDDRNVIIDLHDLDAKVAYSRPLRLLYNVITIAGLVKALNREPTDVIQNMVIAEEAQKLVPKIFDKDIATDTWIATEYATRLRKRGFVFVVISQSPENIEPQIRDNMHVNFLFRNQSEENAKIIAGMLGIYHYARIDHLFQRLVNLQFREAIVKMPESRAFIIHTTDVELESITDEFLSQFMPSIRFDYSEAEEIFLSNIKKFPYIGVAERRAMLGWDEARYAELVTRLIHKGIIEKQNVRLGIGRPRVLYQLKGQKPSIKHEYYVHWLIQELAGKGIVCRAEKIGPDIQIPSMNVAINIELGSSDIYGNIPKALKDFAMVIICSDDKSLLDEISTKTKAENVLCALVHDVPGLFEKKRIDSG